MRRAFGIAFGVVLSLLIGGSVIHHVAFDGMCGNEKLAEHVSPDGASAVVVFVRNCGATTPFSTQASILRPAAELANDDGTLFSADTDHGRSPAGPGGGPEVRVYWEDARHVLLRHHAKARVFRAERVDGEVTVRYETFN